LPKPSSGPWAQRESTGTSVGENAVLALYAREDDQRNRGAPLLLTHFTPQLRMPQHLREEKRSIRMGVLEISPVRATGIQPPVLAGKD
jgi:hypothetical protein